MNRFFLYCVGVLILFWLGFNLLTLSRSPRVWMDEVAYIDPAVTKYLDGQFVSDLWPVEDGGRFWSHNTPGWQFLLTAWLHLFGFSIHSVRLFPLFLLLGGAVLFCFQIRRLGIIRSPVGLLALLTALLFSAAMLFPVRGVRPDSIGLLLIGMLLASFSAPLEPRRLPLAGLTGFLLPWMALQFLPLFAVLTAGTFLWQRTKGALAWGLSVGAGVLAGGAILIGMYHRLGTWEVFWESTRPHVTGEVAHSSLTLGLFFMDPGTLALLAVVVVLLAIYRKRPEVVRPAALAMAAFFLLPVFYVTVGKYPVYYTWIAFVTILPLTIHAMDKVNYTLRFYLFGAVALTCLAGLPARTAVALWQWDERDHGRIVDLVERTAQPGDLIFGDWKVYYAARDTVAPARFSVRENGGNPLPEFTLILVEAVPGMREISFLGQQWRLVDSTLGPLPPPGSGRFIGAFRPAP